ncbi:MAG: hypothetical protein H0T17_05705 [Propionibacteriales bacterium]|nr:hypothetical protein [Propionibacteriales bacterium]
MTIPEHENETGHLLKAALTEEADTVSPDPTALQRIQRRTDSAGSRWRWPLVFGGAGLATAAVVTAVVLTSDGRSPGSAPAADGSSPTTVVQAPAQQVTVPVSYVGSNGKGLYAEQHTLTTNEPPVIVGVREFLAGQPLDSDYVSGWPSGLDVTGVMESSDVVSIELQGPANADLSPSATLGSQSGELAVQALFRTAGLTPGGKGTVMYNGDPVTTVLGVDLPVTGKPDVDVRAMVSIDNIGEGQTVSNPVTVKASGNTFEANLNWQLLDADEQRIDEGSVQVGSYGEWRQADIELGQLDPGTYTIKALEYSMEDGSVASVDDKTFTVN